ncbi:protein kinase (plasmid) [Gemmatirosa kalamazoonensis]|uniref:non-specific serine/threonine protein kinase n=1 Tax=Gemmatirosa kalamazoonensis TaxID=861299 RepID=W0RPK6_9BACT|nr:protein kinase [Gemmatirosa kalamazoonensis]AHG92422.1 protein kinase [Gemmatirosa kalamazoonensis]
MTDLRERLQTSLGDAYTIERELGGGGMSQVFVAEDTGLGRRVVVKVLPAALAASVSIARFRREIALAARLQHPHIVPVLAAGQTDDGLPYYTMPYVEGESLRARLGRGGLPIREAVGVLRDVAKALAYAHAQGIAHRDVKPDNILLTDTSAVITDFGVAKALSASATGEALTSVGIALGTPAYMAPEQAVADPATDARADLYSLGVVAYEMLVGHQPFAGRTGQAVLAAHATQMPTPIATLRPSVPSALAALVMRCLEKRPEDRPQTAREILDALDATPAAGFAPARGARSVALAGGARLALAVGAVVVLLALVAGAFAWRARTGRSASGEIRSLAVLPFVNTSGDRQDDYFSDGLTDELAHALAHVPGLTLAGRTSTYAFKGRFVSAPEIGKALGVRALVTGTVRRAGDRLRVTTQLVSAADGTVMWDSVYESRSGDVFAVQDSLTRAVAAALARTLGGRDDPADRPRATEVTVGRGTTNAEAYELYLKGMYYWHERGAENVARSIGLFQQAIARDPTFARAYAALAFAYEVLRVYVPDPTDSATSLFNASARRAMTLDSTLADAQIAQALAFEHDFRFPEAERYYRAVIAAEPSNEFAHHVLGFMLRSIGRTDEAIAELRVATRLDPLAKSAGTVLGATLTEARRFGEAETAIRRILAIDSTFSLALGDLGLIQALGGRPDCAVRTLERGVRLHPEARGMHGRLLFAYAAAGRWDDAERVRASLHQPGGDLSGGVETAFADFVLDDREPLVRLLTTRAGQYHWISTFGSLGCNPFLDPLWTDARFRAAMRDLGVAPCALARPWPFAPPTLAR